jgi:hypothetical protein
MTCLKGLDDLPPRPTPEAVHDALTSAGFYPEDEVANVLASELIYLQETVERCRSVQRLSAEVAKGLRVEAVAQDSWQDVSSLPARARLYQEFSDELAEALR